MPLTDLRDISPETLIEANICIIGAGAAGMTIASEFANTPYKVILLESGGIHEEAETQSLYDIESVGAPRVMEQREVRNRVLGGSTHTWYGRCAPLEQIDYQPRGWVPYSGWPIQPRDLKDYEIRASQVLGLGSTVYGEGVLSALGIGHEPLSSSDTLRHHFWQYCKISNSDRQVVRFGQHRFPYDASNVHLFLHANVTHINTNIDRKKVESVDVTTLEGHHTQVKADVFILCCGGIENSRLLLASNKLHPQGLGNDHDMVGRFLMDHPGAAIGKFRNISELYQVGKYFGERWLHNSQGKHVYDHGIALSRSIQEKEELLNAAAFLQPVEDSGDPWEAMKSLRDSLKGQAQKQTVLQSVGTIVRHPFRLIRGSYRQAFKSRPPVKSACLYCLVEQKPDPTSRVTLSEKRDQLGMPISKIDWKVSDQEIRTVERLGELISAELRRSGLPEPILYKHKHESKELRLEFRDRAHPIGTTRMSSTPTTGVVDANCKLHTVDGLYVAGTSVFPTSSHVNPTLDIVALSIRLADHIKTNL